LQDFNEIFTNTLDIYNFLLPSSDHFSHRLVGIYFLLDRTITWWDL